MRMNGSDSFDHDAFSVEFASAISDFSPIPSSGVTSSHVHHHTSSAIRNDSSSSLHISRRILGQKHRSPLDVDGEDVDGDEPQHLTAVGSTKQLGSAASRTTVLRMYTPPPSLGGANGGGLYVGDLPGSCYSQDGTTMVVSPAATPVLGIDGHHHPADYYSGETKKKKTFQILVFYSLRFKSCLSINPTLVKRSGKLTLTRVPFFFLLYIPETEKFSNLRQHISQNQSIIWCCKVLSPIWQLLRVQLTGRSYNSIFPIYKI